MAPAPTTEFPRGLRLVIVWLLIGIAVFLGVQWMQSRAERARFSFDAAGTIELRRARDGHFHWPGTLDGHAVDFLVDTGATTTAIPLALAEQLGLALDGDVRSFTAGGEVRGRLARVDLALQGGARVERLRVVVLPRLQAPLLGMDVLSKMSFTQRDGVLRFHEQAR